MRRSLLALVVLLPAAAGATGFTDYGQDMRLATESIFSLSGAFRLRMAALYNLDLDRGPTPSGQLLFPVSLGDPTAQTLYQADMRLRTDIGLQAPGGVVGVKVRIDVLDNMAVGGSTDGYPGAVATQSPPEESAFRIKRAYGEVVTPIGYFVGGRVGHHWGLGMIGNGGDCDDCDSGDAADRIGFITVAVGHIFALAYDFSSSGYLVPTRDESRAVDVEPSAAVRTISVAVLRWKSDASLARRRRAGRFTAEYGLLYAHRWQDNDIPATYLPVAAPPEIDAAQVVRRGLRVHLVDLWVRLTHRYFRIELEAAYASARLEQASTLPGLLLPDEVTSDQFGVALQTDFGAPDGIFTAGLDAGFASGDDAPGFGANPGVGSLTAPQPGDLDGPQGVPPTDLRVDNFRFHPDYRIDRILFREIVGTVTDAIYIRPHFRVRLLDFIHSRLVFSTAIVASWAHKAASAPGGERGLGVEVDPTLSYTTDNGFGVVLDYAILFPLAGLDNPALGLDARLAQLVRLRVQFGF